LFGRAGVAVGVGIEVGDEVAVGRGVADDAKGSAVEVGVAEFAILQLANIKQNQPVENKRI